MRCSCSRNTHDMRAEAGRFGCASIGCRPWPDSQIQLTPSGPDGHLFRAWRPLIRLLLPASRLFFPPGPCGATAVLKCRQGRRAHSVFKCVEPRHRSLDGRTRTRNIGAVMPYSRPPPLYRRRLRFRIGAAAARGKSRPCNARLSRSSVALKP